MSNILHKIKTRDFPLKYKVFVQTGLHDYAIEFKNTVMNILNHKNGWRIPCKEVNTDCDFEIYLVSQEGANGLCGVSTMSCVDDIRGNKIYINGFRWLNGSYKSKLGVHDYRYYVVNHEFGHILGENHRTPIENMPCPIMVQQTLGIGYALPNYLPLKFERDSVLSKI